LAQAPAHAIGLEPDTIAFFEALCQRWGLTAARYRDSILARRQAACLRALRATSPIDGVRAIAADRAASERALGAVMIGVTEFFRDAAVFATLRCLLRSLKRGSEPLSVLSVGCSDGSELYSLAMLMAEQGLLAGARLRGIDCRPGAVESAVAGIYSTSAADAVPPALRARYMSPMLHSELPHAPLGPRMHTVRVVDGLRAACQWAVADAFTLSFDAEAADACDLILCRNLTIYLTPGSAAALWALCVDGLRPGGLLVVGKAERPPAEIRPRLSQIGACMYRRR
jgi:chemotaxis protein methyltransferase CheR